MAAGPNVQFSVSTWQQPVPTLSTPARARVVEQVAAMVDALGVRRLRAAIDGLTASGKTTFGHELAVALVQRGRPALRASLDDFKRPWCERHEYDRESGAGYYRNAYDYDAVRRLLLDPASPAGDGRVALCAIDPLTQVDHSAEMVAMAPNAVLVVDGVFACRPELNAAWDLRVWLDIDEETSLQRGTARDGGAQDVHRNRYLASEQCYLAEVDARAFADVVIDNTDIARPRLVRPPA